MKHFSFLFLILSSINSFAASVPACLSQSGQRLEVDNARTIELERTTPNQYVTQAHVQGVISDLYPDRNGHQHFAIQFPGTAVGIEVVYNAGFGDLPDLRVGMTVEACGEYITSNQPTDRYPASPMGAIIHWVHRNPHPRPGAHPSGFLVINGQICGQNAAL